MARILLCEDSIFFLQAIESLLNSHGYEVLTADDGEKALDLIKKQPDLDLILCDIQMPIVDGYEVLDQVRNKMGMRNLPFIFLTSMSDQASLDKAQQLQVTDYFVKSNVSMEKIVDLVNKYLEKKETDS